MSNRPDWCPADVWAEADEAASTFMGTGLQRIIARAILSERERCATHLKDKAEILYVDYNDKAGQMILDDVSWELLNPSI